MGTLLILVDAMTRGGKVLWDPADRPKLMLPRGVREKLEPERETVKEILRRAVVFREQAAAFIQDGRPLPVLALPGAPDTPGACISCGGDLSGGRHRCPVCALAVKLALEEIP